jgi:outer membrane protein TolC
MAAEVHRREVVRLHDGIAREVDADRALAAVEARRTDLLRNYERIRVISDQLKLLMNWSTLTIDSGVEMIPTDQPRTDVLIVDEAEAINTALENRPRLNQAKKTVEIRTIEVDLARHKQLPSLDAFGRYALDGYGDDMSDAIDSMEFSDRNSWAVGLKFEWPWDNVSAKARYRKNLSRYKQSISEVERLEDQIKREVKEALSAIKLAHDEIESTLEATEAAAKVVEGETARFELAQVTNAELLRAQDLLAGAKRRNIRAIVDYNVALAQLARAQGVLGHGFSIKSIKKQ